MGHTPRGVTIGALKSQITAYITALVEPLIDGEATIRVNPSGLRGCHEFAVYGDPERMGWAIGRSGSNAESIRHLVRILVMSKGCSNDVDVVLMRGWAPED